MLRQQDASLARLRGSYCHTTINRNHRGRCRWGFGIVTLTGDQSRGRRDKTGIDISVCRQRLSALRKYAAHGRH